MDVQMESSLDNESVDVSITEASMEDCKSEVFKDDSSCILWVPKCDEDKKPSVQQNFPNVDTAFEYYKEYGRACGFDVRRSTEKTDRHGDIILKYFVCSRGGSNESKNFDPVCGKDLYKHRSRRTISAKCNCLAKLTLGVSVGGGFSIKKIIETYNHPFASSDDAQFLRYSRSVSDFQKRFIVDAAKLNIGATRAHGIIKAMSGSYENVGATVVDFKNFSRDVKKHIEKHDADMIIQKFKDIQSSSDDAFKFDYETESNNHLTRPFWADGIGRQSYEVFGDVLSFDATYRTRKYNMVFVPLIGVDNHWKSVTFAEALLDNESSESFIWLYNAFKRVFRRDPKCIITNQCPAMKITIESCFRGVKHRLCMWHIMKKFPAKLGSLFCAESPFMDCLNNFVWCDNTSPEEFEHGWNEVVSEFELTDNKWLAEMYEIRKSWVPMYFNHDPMVGLLRTTSRSESSNFYFNHFVQKGDTLSEFYLCYDSAIVKQRNISKKLNHYDGIMLRTILQKEIEKYTAQLYTRTMFYKIQEEILAGGGVFEIETMDLTSGIKKVSLKDPIKHSRFFQVSLKLETQDVNCSCNMFTRVGYLCSHAFFCLGINGINNIPRQYICNRWLKNAVERFTTLKLGEISDPTSEEGAKHNKIKECWFEFQACISDASGNQDHIEFVQKSLIAIRNKIKVSSKKGNTRLDDEMIEEIIGTKVVEDISILPPNQSNNKGSRKRLVNPDEKSLGGKKREMRKCKACRSMAFHDSRNCPNKNSK